MFYSGLFEPEVAMPNDAIAFAAYRRGQNSLSEEILAMSSSAFENPSLASAVTFRGTRYAIGQYVVLKVNHFTSEYAVGKILQCVIDSGLQGEKVKFILRLYDAEENIPGVLTVMDKSKKEELCTKAVSDLADYCPLTVLKGRNSTLILHHFISICPHAHRI
jgi:hypothetical protein